MDIHRFGIIWTTFSPHCHSDTRKLPALHRGTDIAGTLTPEAAQSLGLKSGYTGHHAGGGDGACANAALPGLPAATCTACIVTTAWLAYDAAGPVLDKDKRVFQYSLVDGRNVGLSEPCRQRADARLGEILIENKEQSAFKQACSTSSARQRRTCIPPHYLDDGTVGRSLTQTRAASSSI